MELLLFSIGISLFFFLLLILIFISTFFLKIYVGKSIKDPTYPPIKGTIFHLVFHLKHLYDHQTKIAKTSSTFRLLAITQSEIYTTNPRNIEHVLKHNFDKYDKGENNKDIFRDLFGHGIFAVDGEKWKQQRKLASYEFSTRVLRDFSCAIFRTNAVKLVGIVSELSRAKQAFDIYDLLSRYALDSIFKVGFGMDLNCLDGSSKDGAQFMKAFDEAHQLVFWRFFDPFWKLKRIFNLGSEAALKRNIQILDRFVYGLINHKRKLLIENQFYIEKEDILSRFLDASKKDPEKMNDKYLRDIILNFMIAGKDTTAGSLSWFLYMLCVNPIVQEKLVQEITQVLPNNARLDSLDNFVGCLTDEILEKLHYLHASLTETLRLFPAVPVDGRSALVDDILPDGYKVKKGDNVNYLAYAMGRMHHLWGDDVLDFRPERWLDTNGVFQPQSPFKFPSFHGGPRICLGKDFAYRQMKIVSVALLSKFRFKLGHDKKPVTYKAMLTLHMDGGLHVQALPRHYVHF